MANLDTTVNNIELKTNRLNSEADLDQMATWDDEKYPTTALLRNVVNDLNSRIVDSGAGGAAATYPVALGSVIMTYKDTNPGQEESGPLPGHWELVDKAFKHELVQLTTNDWTVGTGIASLDSGTMIRDGHMISLHLELQLGQQLSGKNVILGNINRTSCGISTNSGQFYSQGNRGLAYAYNSSNNTNFVVCYTFSGDGTITIQEVLSSSTSGLTMPAGSIIIIDTIAIAEYDKMLTEACDRFYWKRTA